jgi:flavorubredoxin
MHVTLRPGIDWVGYVDWTVRDFHGYETSRGSTYNAYLVRGEKTALIDAVKAPYADQLLENLRGMEVGGLDYVVCNHAEPDHSGALPRVMQEFPNALLVCTAKCQKALSEHFDISTWRFHIVANGQTLPLGRFTLRFLETPMVHWPESTFTYVEEERILFSMDAFGQHYATSARFDDETPLATALDEAKTYYANIVMPYGKAVTPCLKKAAELAIDMIAPSHGVIWRSHVAEIVAAYHDWVACRAKPKVLVLYDSMWESTAVMAQAILQGAAQPGIDAQLIPLRATGLTRIAAETLDAACVALGSSTLNRGPLPAAAAALSYLDGLRPEGKVGLAFGSFGWAPGGSEKIHEGLKSLGWEMLREPIRAKYRPTPAILDECRAAGRMLAERARQRG